MSANDTVRRRSSLGNGAGNGGAGVTVFCLHYAGGSASVFEGGPHNGYEWQSVLAAAAGVERVVGVELPGHGTRRSEEALTDLASIVDDVLRSTKLDALLPSTGGHDEGEGGDIGVGLGDFVLFGHSFGALVMHAVAAALHSRGAKRLPARLIVAAQAACELNL